MVTIVLLALLSAAVGAQDPACISSCLCDSSHFVNVEPARRTFLLRCTIEDSASALDWSTLGSTSRDLTILLEFSTGTGRLRRQHLPSGRAVVSVETRGAGGVDGDALENVKGTLLHLNLEFSPVAVVDWSMPYLRSLPRLRGLSLELDDEATQPVSLASTPFKGTGLDLQKLSFYGGNFVSFTPDFFQGLSAQHVLTGNNNFSSFPWEALAKIRKLEKLEIFNSPIQHIEDGATDGMKLKDLQLSNTQTESVSEKAFRGVRDTLETLMIKECRLKEIPVEALAPLKRLRTLDLKNNPISTISRPLYGDVCPTSIWLGTDDLDTDVFESVHPDAFKAVGHCLKHLALLGVQLTEFPTDVLQDLTEAGSILLESASLTRLQTGALRGISVRVLNIWAPLEDIEPGAFDDMRHYPVSLTLQGTRLRNASFFYEYPGKTFSSLKITSFELECDCELEGIRRNLLEHNKQEDIYGELLGSCRSDRVQNLLFSSQQFIDMFANCTNITILEPRVIGAAATHGSVLALLLLVWGAVLLAI